MDRAELRRLAEWAIRAKNANGSRTAFHTAANPTTIIALLDEIEALAPTGLRKLDADTIRALMDENDRLRSVAVRLKLALQELESRVFEDGAPDDVLEETQGILADPEVEKL